MTLFDEARYLAIQSGALAQGPAIHAAIGACLARGAKNLFFLGTGGAAILMQPAGLMLQRRTGFPVYLEISAELVAGGHAELGRHSIVVIPSLSGTTRESLAAMELCKAKGATVIALTGHGDSPLAEGAHYALVNFAEDDTSSESFYLQSLLIALSLLHQRREIADYAVTVAELNLLPGLLVAVKRSFAAEAERYASAIKAEPYHIITGAGGAWPQAWYYAMCILEEMQWIRTRPVHAADFFHGTLELIEPGVSVMIFQGEDAYRALTGRAEGFARQYTEKVFVLDAASFDLPGLSPATRALISPVILAAALERLSAALEVVRDHPLTTRRYYKRVQY